MRSTLKRLILILSMLLGLLGGCALDLVARRGGDSLEVHTNPETHTNAGR